MLHRSICTNEQLADCSLVARLLYTWGLPHTSDWGVLSASPRHLNAQVFPLSDETAADVQAATEELCAAGLWVRFDADGGSYVCYPTFDKYQDLHQRRVNTRDGMPLPPDYAGRPRKTREATGSSDEFPEVPGSSRKSPEVPDSSGEFPRTKGMEGKGSEGNGKKERIPASADAEPIPVRPNTPAQAAANACLALYGLTHTDLPGPQAGAYFKAMHSLIGQLEHGAEELQAWADEQAAFGPRVLGNGTKPERAIPSAVRKALTASSWQAAFAATRASPGGKPGPGQRWLLNDDGSRTYEREWTAEQRLSIDMAVTAGIWDQERGIATDDPRHPDCPPAIRRAIQQGARL